MLCSGRLTFISVYLIRFQFGFVSFQFIFSTVRHSSEVNVRSGRVHTGSAHNRVAVPGVGSGLFGLGLESDCVITRVGVSMHRTVRSGHSGQISCPPKNIYLQIGPITLDL